MSEDLYSDICKYFGIHPVKQFISGQQNIDIVKQKILF